MSKVDDDELRDKIGGMLRGGLVTDAEPLPQDRVQFEDILQRLRTLREGDLEQKLVTAGFRDHGKKQQRCLECIYYLVHRKWCDLPELAIPVEPEWWCRLWRT